MYTVVVLLLERSIYKNETDRPSRDLNHPHTHTPGEIEINTHTHTERETKRERDVCIICVKIYDGLKKRERGERREGVEAKETCEEVSSL